MRICVVYDCLYPYTVGGGERWYGRLAERLAREGHEVSYVTLRQWERGRRPQIGAGVRVIAVGPRMSLYTPGGRRRILPPLVFGAGVLVHMLRHGRRYDVVDTAAFPYFSLLAAAAARPLHRFALVVDWFEVWSGSYWREYLGPLGGRIGALVQRLCARVPQRAFCLSQLHAQRLREEGLRGEVTVLRGLYDGPGAGGGAEPGAGGPGPGAGSASASSARAHADAPGPDGADAVLAPTVLFAARLIPEKRVGLALAAIAGARERIASLRGEILGDGPERALLEDSIRDLGLADAVDAPGFADAATVERWMRSALCMLLTSRREGYGLVVVEAAAHGTPSIVVAGEDNAAVELIEEGVNGTVAQSDDPRAVAEAIVRVHAAGPELRRSTAAWFERNRERLSLESSLREVLAVYSSQEPKRGARARA